MQLSVSRSLSTGATAIINAFTLFLFVKRLPHLMLLLHLPKYRLLIHSSTDDRVLPLSRPYISHQRIVQTVIPNYEHNIVTGDFGAAEGVRLLPFGTIDGL